MGGMVTKQAIWKYENGKANPSPSVLSKLASALGVSASYLLTESSVKVEFIAYRKGAYLLERDRQVLKSSIEQALEDRVRVMDLVGQSDASKIPIKAFRVDRIEDAEEAAEKMREKWQLGLDPVQNATATLEENSICVMNIEANEDFDGISALVYDNEERLKTAALVTRSGIAGERQRLNLTHELGHLVLEVNESVDEERAAFRFGAAFLAPASKVYQEVGEKRALIQLEEFILLKRQFGLSIQALIYRLHDLDIINDSYYSQLFAGINRYGWKKKEPEEWPFEESYWLTRTLLRLVAEGVIGKREAERIFGKEIEMEVPATVIERRSFMKLPLEKRRQILAEQAAKIAGYYETSKEWKELEGGDLIEY
jgi:Zn-dependent peptidase ImmA (M78 family)/DNA-binding XRE family transcriptional regulator